ETNELSRRNPEQGSGLALRERRKKYCQDLVYRISSNPGLDSEPTARHERPQQRRDVRPNSSERRPAINRKRNPIQGPTVRVQHNRDQQNEVAKKNRHPRVPPVHPPADQ